MAHPRNRSVRLRHAKILHVLENVKSMKSEEITAELKCKHGLILEDLFYLRKQKKIRLGVCRLWRIDPDCPEEEGNGI